MFDVCDWQLFDWLVTKICNGRAEVKKFIFVLVTSLPHLLAGDKGHRHRPCSGRF